MEYCLSHSTITSFTSLPSSVKSLSITNLSISGHNNLAVKSSSSSSFPRIGGGIIEGGGCGKRFIVVASSGACHREFCCLNLPLETRSAAGKLLKGIFQNERELFYGSVAEQLKKLALDRDAAVSRMAISSGSAESCLYRRIAEVEQKECQMAIEDVLYMLVIYNFSEIKVHLVPKLSTCMYNSRLELWPSNVWDLESIHSSEVLQMVREHIMVVTGLRPNSSVRDEWAPTKIHRLHLSRVYTASILYGYFLKSACLRHHMELSLSLGLAHTLPLSLTELSPHGLKSNTQTMELGHGINLHGRDSNKLRCYVSGFDQDTVERCTKIKYVEAINLVQKHTWALFGIGKKGSVETDEVISTSFSSLKRLLLEGFAFGSFLWDAEEYVGARFKLKDN